MMHILSNMEDSKCYLRLDNINSDHYAPPHLNIGEGGDYVEFDVCVNCGQMQGQWPLPSNVMTQNL